MKLKFCKCRNENEKRKKFLWCEHLRSPMFHSGYTGKSGPETWWRCLAGTGLQSYVRNIKKCPLEKI